MHWTQLKFRRHILEHHHNDLKNFTLSQKDAQGKYKPHTIQHLKNSVEILIKAAAQDQETASSDTAAKPLLVGKIVEHKLADQVWYNGQ